MHDLRAGGGVSPRATVKMVTPPSCTAPLLVLDESEQSSDVVKGDPAMRSLLRTWWRPSAFHPAVASAIVVVCAVSGVAGVAPGAHTSGGPPHWTYEGEEGPEHWGDLDASFETCKTGHLQSPIDIPAASIKAEPLDPIRFDYHATPLRVTDNGHTEMVTCAPGSAMHVGQAAYALQQFHFHMPSEEMIDGKPFAMVAHLVHKSEDGRLAVVAVLFQEGAANPALATVLAHLPGAAGKEEAPAGVDVDVTRLLPANASYITYQGSLTTPPCTEGVTWYVLRTPATASKEQIALFARRYPHNARPVQPLDGREIHASR